ncbi:hypothetical protein GCM10010517_23160 [Streptosporangium fragile]|uniref:Leucine-rich repeat domain-containing protein n=1 Tax=Streptosporangium fragile TaxID=46186 RepID=A0ABN3VVD9_9ACTN
MRPEDNRSAAAARISDCLRDGSTRLDLSGLGLETVPEPLGDLTHLTELDLGRNELTALPGWLGDLTALTTLYQNRNGAAPPGTLSHLTLTAPDLGPLRGLDHGVAASPARRGLTLVGSWVRRVVTHRR